MVDLLTRPINRFMPQAQNRAAADARVPARIGSDQTQPMMLRNVDICLAVQQRGRFEQVLDRLMINTTRKVATKLSALLG
jgi:hypothetical protein